MNPPLFWTYRTVTSWVFYCRSWHTSKINAFSFQLTSFDIALTLCDSIALIDRPHLHYLPTQQMINSGHIERLFRNETITFDPKELRIRIR